MSLNQFYEEFRTFQPEDWQKLKSKAVDEQEKINELLKPRYKVLIDYPGSDYEVGEIIHLTNHHSNEFYSVTEDGAVLEQESFYKAFPKVFESLHWWKHRRPHEMPKYVKNAADGIVFKVEYNFNSNTPSDVHTWNEQFRIPFWHSLYDLLPATEADYNEYLQTLTNNQEP